MELPRDAQARPTPPKPRSVMNPPQMGGNVGNAVTPALGLGLREVWTGMGATRVKSWNVSVSDLPHD
jgi:hypothetical protein